MQHKAIAYSGDPHQHQGFQHLLPSELLPWLRGGPPHCCCPIEMPTHGSEVCMFITVIGSSPPTPYIWMLGWLRYSVLGVDPSVLTLFLLTASSSLPCVELHIFRLDAACFWAVVLAVPPRWHHGHPSLGHHGCFPVQTGLRNGHKIFPSWKSLDNLTGNHAAFLGNIIIGNNNNKDNRCSLIYSLLTLFKFPWISAWVSSSSYMSGT